MFIKHQIDPSYNYAIAQLFRPSLLQKLNNPSDEQHIQALLKSCKLYPEDTEWELIKALEISYRYLKQNYRCEYIYKNEIANQLLLKHHNDNSATLLKEVTSDRSIADVVIINGSTVAYEIKTELDSFDRLDTQINSYKFLYDNIYVVTHPSAVKLTLSKTEGSVGIMVLNNSGILETIRKAAENVHLFDPAKAFITLRQSELVTAYQKYVGELPTMGTALIHSFCHEWFLSLEKMDAHAVFAESLKSRKPSSLQFELIQQCSPALKMLFLGKVFSKKYCLSTMDIF
jgi:hypothetical protein